jgi:hypothetical protein
MLDLGFPPLIPTNLEIGQSVQMEQFECQFGTGKYGKRVDGTKCAGSDGYDGFGCGCGHE